MMAEEPLSSDGPITGRDRAEAISPSVIIQHKRSGLRWTAQHIEALPARFALDRYFRVGNYQIAKPRNEARLRQ
jgi:hypothetical protein